MKITFLSTVIAVLFSACQSNSNSQQTTDKIPSGVHKVVVEEVLQTSKYTYLRVKENNIEQWLAVSKMEASVGETYYYDNGLLMTDFASKELNRTFKEILFLDQISSTPVFAKKEIMNVSPNDSNPHGSMTSGQQTNPNTTTEKKEIKLEHGKGEITIAELFKSKQSYSGKKIKVKGQVTKFSPDIMNKNWIHIQDGTDNAGKFDLTVTTDININVKVGDIVTFEGAIALNKDLGFGYVYEVIMEDAKVVK